MYEVMNWNCNILVACLHSEYIFKYNFVETPRKFILVVFPVVINGVNTELFL